MTPLPFSPKQMLLIGGYTQSGRKSRAFYVLHTDNMKWQQVTSCGSLFPIIRAGHKATVVSDNVLIISGGFAQKHFAPFYWLDFRMLTNK